jgi:hypothetical protein
MTPSNERLPEFDPGDVDSQHSHKQTERHAEAERHQVGRQAQLSPASCHFRQLLQRHAIAGDIQNIAPFQNRVCPPGLRLTAAPQRVQMYPETVLRA